MTCIHLRAGPIRDAVCSHMAFLFIGCMVLMTNCNLFKNTATDLQKSHALSTSVTQFKSTEQKDYLSTSGSVSFHQDSSDNGYSIQIWPRGMFTYSPGKGFSGEADKVLVTGKAKSGSVSTGSSNSLQIDRGKIQRSLNVNEMSVSDQKLKTKRTSPSWKWMIAALAFMMVVGCFAYTKMKLLFKNRRW